MLSGSKYNNGVKILNNRIEEVFIISPGYGIDTTDPGGRDSYELVKYLAERNSGVHFYVLTILETPDSNNITSVRLKQYDYLFRRINKYYSNDYKGLFRKMLKKCFYKAIMPFALLSVQRGEKDGQRPYYIDYRDYRKWMYREKKNHISKNNVLISYSNPFYSQLYAKDLFEEYKIKKWTTILLDPHSDGKYIINKNQAIEEERCIFDRCTTILTVDEVMFNRKVSPIIEYGNKWQSIPTHILVDNTDWEKTLLILE